MSRLVLLLSIVFRIVSRSDYRRYFLKWIDSWTLFSIDIGNGDGKEKEQIETKDENWTRDKMITQRKKKLVTCTKDTHQLDGINYYRKLRNNWIEAARLRLTTFSSARSFFLLDCVFFFLHLFWISRNIIIVIDGVLVCARWACRRLYSKTSSQKQ